MPVMFTLSPRWTLSTISLWAKGCHHEASALQAYFQETLGVWSSACQRTQGSCGSAPHWGGSRHICRLSGLTRPISTRTVWVHTRHWVTSPLSSPDTDFENKSILLQAEITTVSEESFYLYDQRICGDFLPFKLKEFLLWYHRKKVDAQVANNSLENLL